MSAARNPTHINTPLDPATWPHTRSFLAILEESGLETARAQFFLTHAEAETVCAWANAPTRKNPTVIILEDDPETEDFRPADPREHAEYYQVGDGVYIGAAPGGSLETSTIPPGAKRIVPEFVGRIVGEAFSLGNPAGSIGGSPPPSAAADATDLALKTAHTAMVAADDLIFFARGPHPGASPHDDSFKIVDILSEALAFAIELYRAQPDNGRVEPLTLGALGAALNNFLESQNG